MTDVLPVMGVIATGGALIALFAHRTQPEQAAVVATAFVAHVAASFLQYWITLAVYGSGDMTMYLDYGEALSRLMDIDFNSFAPEVFALFLQERADLPIQVTGAGSSTGSMSALGAFLMFVLGSRYAVCVAMAIFSLSGKMALVFVFRENLAPRYHTVAAAAALLVPSVTYWSAGLIKESVAIAALGWAILGVHCLLQKRLLSAAIALPFGAALLAQTKAYVLFPLAVASTVWWYWSQSRMDPRGRRPAYVAVVIVAAVGVIILLGEIFPRYAFDNVAEEMASLQTIGARVGGGSYYEIGNAEERTLAGQLAYAPIALATSLFRPFIFEVANSLMLINALETTAITVAFLVVLRRHRLGWIRRAIASQGILMFGLTFALLFGTAVGLATTNLGTLSRYRAPLMPFLALIAGVLAVAGSGAPRTHAAPSASKVR